MFKAIRQSWESFMFAVKALRENILRTLLSLLGVSVGVFSIIGMFTGVDALDKGIRGSLSFLGEDVIYVEKWPWVFSNDYPWWKYIKRPNPTYDEFKFLKKNLTESTALSIFAVRGGNTIKYKQNSQSGTAILGVSYEHNKVADIPIAEGRYFTEGECSNGANVVLVGQDVVKSLFVGESALGKDIKIRGQKYRVIGILERQGDNLLGAPSNDGAVFIPFFSITKLFYAGARRGITPTIAAKGYEDDKGLLNLENDIRGLLRAKRGIRPTQEDSFAMNRPEVFAKFVDSLSQTLGFAGSVIGLFALLVGGIGIANIMFVSVKERTHIIGIKKSLGAKNTYVLFEFLFEAMLLSFIGGVVGLTFVFLASFIPLGSLELELSFSRMLMGTAIAVSIGVISGIIPAIIAARMNPVDAIRAK
ncbi:MAG: ABC transporter permease [Bacteroidota bacterium]